MKYWALLFVTISLLGCGKDQSIAEPKALDGLDYDAAVADVSRYFGNGAKVKAICGASTGSFLYVESDGVKLESDSITNGIVGLGFDKLGKPDIVRRDAMKVMMRLSEDGGIVNFLPSSRHAGLGAWTISYPSTGVVESYVLSKLPDGSIVSVWTSAKPEMGATLRPRGLLMYSKCKVVNAQTY